MASLCRTCNRVNPAEAAYCYFDGTALDSRGRGPVAAGSQVFARPLFLPSGKACHNFDELALACQEDWPGSLTLLRQGYFETFLVGLGRADLATFAREAARYPDPDRGLDQFLAKLPARALESPRLRVQPQEINLGVLQINGQRRFAFRLENQGMRLLYGSVTTDGCPWLALGEPPGQPEKLFHFRDELIMPVVVCNQRLRASQQPLEGRLLVTSNGGSAAVTIRAEVPVKPFPEGVLAGAVSPRLLARKAKAAPRAAGALFQNGAVARWYQDNGWTYPVQVPSASGLGAVQQFFEALGLVSPPQVELSTLAVGFLGDPGDQLHHLLEARTKEKRPVWAHAVSDQSWLKVGPVKLSGQVASMPLVIPAVPDCPGETLNAQVVVTANGNQRFIVSVALAVTGEPLLEAEPVLEVVEDVEPVLEVLEAEPAFDFDLSEPVARRASPPRLPRRRRD